MASLRCTLGSLTTAFIAASLVGCSPDAPASEELVGQAIDSLEVTESESGVLIASAEAAPLMQGDTPESLAKRATATWPLLFTPSKCATADDDATHVTYTLNDCVGKRRAAPLTGTIDVVFTLSGEGDLREDASTKALTAGGALITFDTGAELKGGADGMSLSVHTVGDGRGPGGNELSREGDYSIGWDDACFTLDGSWTTTALEKTWSTTVSGFRECAKMCPDAGGRIDYEGGIDGVAITIDFDGTASASWSDSKGRTGSIALVCDGA